MVSAALHGEPAGLAHLGGHLQRRALTRGEHLGADVVDREPAVAARAQLQQHLDGERQVVAHGEHERGVAGGQAVGAVGRGEQRHPRAQPVHGGADVPRGVAEAGGVVAPGDRGRAGDGRRRRPAAPRRVAGDGAGEVVAGGDGVGDVGQTRRVEQHGVPRLGDGARRRPPASGGDVRPRAARTQPRQARGVGHHRADAVGPGVDVARGSDEDRRRRAGGACSVISGQLGQVALLGQAGAAGRVLGLAGDAAEGAVGHQDVERPARASSPALRTVAVVPVEAGGPRPAGEAVGARARRSSIPWALQRGERRRRGRCRPPARRGRCAARRRARRSGCARRAPARAPRRRRPGRRRSVGRSASAGSAVPSPSRCLAPGASSSGWSPRTAGTGPGRLRTTTSASPAASSESASTSP